MADITLQQAQQMVRLLDLRPNGVRYFNELTNMTILTEEVGELAGSWHVPTVSSLSRKVTNTGI